MRLHPAALLVVPLLSVALSPMTSIARPACEHLEPGRTTLVYGANDRR
jgi:hypothetical protein